MRIYGQNARDWDARNMLGYDIFFTPKPAAKPAAKPVVEKAEVTRTEQSPLVVTGEMWLKMIQYWYQ